MSVQFESADTVYLLQGTEALPISLKGLKDPQIHTVIKIEDKPNNFTDILDKIVVPDFNSFWIYDDDMGNTARLVDSIIQLLFKGHRVLMIAGTDSWSGMNKVHLTIHDDCVRPIKGLVVNRLLEEHGIRLDVDLRMQDGSIWLDKEFLTRNKNS